MTNDDEAREARSVACADAPGRESLIGKRIRVQKYTMGHPTHQDDYTIEEYRHCPGIFLSKAHRTACEFTPLCELYDPAPGAERRYLSNHGEYYDEWVQGWMDLPTPVARSEREDTQTKPDWNPNEGVVCDGSTNHIEFQPTPSQADVDALVEAVTELRAAEWAGVGLSSAKMADRVTPDQIKDGAFRVLEAQKRVDAALTPFQKG